LLGIELELNFPINDNISFTGFIDVAIADELSGKIKIIDFKTSTYGWNDYAKKNESKTAQILLYKKFYSEIFNVKQDMIDVEFVILKRKLYENVDFPQKRIQRFSPASGNVSVNKSVKMLTEFVDTAFTSDGEYNTNRHYKLAETDKLCKYCEFYKKDCFGPKK
jgi:hypothetical protein